MGSAATVEADTLEACGFGGVTGGLLAFDHASRLCCGVPLYPLHP